MTSSNEKSYRAVEMAKVSARYRLRLVRKVIEKLDKKASSRTSVSAH